MPDFNKGDFTQQGVAGHVNANLRLNEKRLVNIDLTSNEEAEGCTITGNVTDLLNNKVYGIGAGASGNIEITENGENINVAPYATATVAVPTPSGNIIISENTPIGGDPLDISQYATAIIAVPSSGPNFVIPEQTRNFPDTGRVFLTTDFPEVLTDNIIVQLIGTAYGQPIHALLIAGKATDEGGYAQYIGEATNRIAGQSMTMRLTLGKLADEENWGAYINVNNVQTAFSNVLISGIAEWETTPV